MGVPVEVVIVVVVGVTSPNPVQWGFIVVKPDPYHRVGTLGS